MKWFIIIREKYEKEISHKNYMQCAHKVHIVVLCVFLWNSICKVMQMSNATPSSWLVLTDCLLQRNSLLTVVSLQSHLHGDIEWAVKYCYFVFVYTKRFGKLHFFMFGCLFVLWSLIYSGDGIVEPHGLSKQFIVK